MDTESLVQGSACGQGFFLASLLLSRQEQDHPNEPEYTAAFDVPDTGRSFVRTNLNKVIAQNEVPVFDPTSHRLAACLQCNGRFVSSKPFGSHDA